MINIVNSPTGAGPKRDAQGLELGVCRINGIPYLRPVILVASIKLDGGPACIVLASELMDFIEDGNEYTVQIKKIPARDFDRLPEFVGW